MIILTGSLPAVWPLQQPGSPECRERSASGCHRRTGLAGSGLMRAGRDTIKLLFCWFSRCMKDGMKVKGSHANFIQTRHTHSLPKSFDM